MGTEPRPIQDLKREPHGANGPRPTRFAQSLAFRHSSQSFLVLFNWIPNFLPQANAYEMIQRRGAPDPQASPRASATTPFADGRHRLPEERRHTRKGRADGELCLDPHTQLYHRRAEEVTLEEVKR